MLKVYWGVYTYMDVGAIARRIWVHLQNSHENIWSTFKTHIKSRVCPQIQLLKQRSATLYT